MDLPIRYLNEKGQLDDSDTSQMRYVYDIMYGEGEPILQILLSTSINKSFIFKNETFGFKNKSFIFKTKTFIFSFEAM